MNRGEKEWLLEAIDKLLLAGDFTDNKELIDAIKSGVKIIRDADSIQQQVQADEPDEYGPELGGDN